jgi:hypothetical protein
MKMITEILYSELELRNNFSVDDLSEIYNETELSSRLMQCTQEKSL